MTQEKTKVYVVFYPDYFGAVYSTREKAEAAIKRASDEYGEDDLFIEEEELDREDIGYLYGG